jgi:DNA repair protein RadC
MSHTQDLTGTYHATLREMPSDERPRERLAQHGAGSLQTAELLAVILRTGTERDNAIEMAHKLLINYGGLAGLLRADFAELCAEHGLGFAKVAQIKAALEIGLRLALTAVEDRPRISSPDDVFRLVGVEMAALSQEQLRVLLLDTKNGVMHIQTVYTGTVNASLVRAAEIVRPAVMRNCPSIIIVHNHPSGDPSPSSEDVRMTTQVRQAAAVLDIALLDHVVIGQGRHVSLREQGLGFAGIAEQPRR